MVLGTSICHNDWRNWRLKTAIDSMRWCWYFLCVYYRSWEVSMVNLTGYSHETFFYEGTNDLRRYACRFSPSPGTLIGTYSIRVSKRPRFSQRTAIRRRAGWFKRLHYVIRSNVECIHIRWFWLTVLRAELLKLRVLKNNRKSFSFSRGFFSKKNRQSW